MQPTPEMHRLLDLARWAPSGDNTQPWRFEVLGPRALRIHGNDTRTHCVYDLEGEASQLSIGCLIQTVETAATGLGWAAQVHRIDAAPEHPTFDVAFEPDASVSPSPWLDCITRRSVNRYRYSTRPLTAEQRASIEQAAGHGFSIRWMADPKDKRAMASLLYRNAWLRLNMREAYEVHRSVIEWNADTSDWGVPDAALGVDRMTRKIMKFAMADWQRVSFANRFLGGSLLPRIQMDWLPGVFCGAHLALLAEREPQTVDDFIAAGRAVQRVWLEVTRLGLCLQPAMTPLIFARYLRRKTSFTKTQAVNQACESLEPRLRALLGPEYVQTVWLSRTGWAPSPSARSIRKPVEALLQT